MALLDLLTWPIVGPVKGLAWVAEQIAQEADREFFDEDRVRGELAELQMRYELGEVTEGVYAQEETALLRRLNAIREAKKE